MSESNAMSSRAVHARPITAIRGLPVSFSCSVFTTSTNICQYIVTYQICSLVYKVTIQSRHFDKFNNFSLKNFRSCAIQKIQHQTNCKNWENPRTVICKFVDQLFGWFFPLFFKSLIEIFRKSCETSGNREVAKKRNGIQMRKISSGPSRVGRPFKRQRGIILGPGLCRRFSRGFSGFFPAPIARCGCELLPFRILNFKRVPYVSCTILTKFI